MVIKVIVISISINITKFTMARSKKLIKRNSKIDGIKTAENLGVVEESDSRSSRVNIVRNSRKIKDRNRRRRA